MKNLFETTMSKLKEAIEEQGSIRALADRLDLNPSTISRWFAEGRSPDFRMLAIIFEHLGVQIVFPSDAQKPTPTTYDKDIKILQDKIDILEKERDHYQSKWEGHLESLRAQAGLDSVNHSQKSA